MCTCINCTCTSVQKHNRRPARALPETSEKLLHIFSGRELVHIRVDIFVWLLPITWQGSLRVDHTFLLI